MSEARAVDICIVGATGHTGRIACEFARRVNLARLAKNKKELKLGFCARNEANLNAVVKFYTHGAAAAAAEPASSSSGEDKALIPKEDKSSANPVVLSATTFLVPDFSDREAIDRVAKQCKVLVSYAGPFTVCGEAVLSACCRNATHYIDVTAELNWMKRMELKYNDEFAKNHVKCIPCCGFDFLPNDLLMMQLKMVMSESESIKNWGGAESMLEVTHGCSQSTPMVSPGTALSAYLIIRSFGSLYQALEFYFNPYCISLTEKSKALYNLGLTRLMALPANFMRPRPMTDQRVCSKVEILQSDEPPKLASFQNTQPDNAMNREYCVKFCMSYLMTKYMHWSNEKQGHYFGKDLAYFGGEIRRNVVSAYFWSIMVWVGVVYLFTVSLLPQQYAKYFLPREPSPLDPENDYLLAHLKASWPQGDVQFKWRMMGGECYQFAAKGSFLAALCLAEDSREMPKEYGLLPPSVAIGSSILNELVEYGDLEVSSAQLRTY